jgi:hypothetical protein
MVEIAVLILVLIAVRALFKTAARLPEPETTANAIAANTKAYSTKSWPDSSAWKFFNSSRVRIEMLLGFKFLIDRHSSY